MKNIEKHMSILGKSVKDRVTGKTGVATSIAFDLYGCIQVILTPKADKENKTGDGHWYDIRRLEITDNVPVMAIPDFDLGYISEGKKGGQELPMQ